MARDLFYYPACPDAFRIEKRSGLFYPQKRKWFFFWSDLKGRREVTLSAAWKSIDLYRKVKD